MNAFLHLFASTSSSLLLISATTSFVLILLFNFASSLEINDTVITIHNASDFVEFSENVNDYNILYEGTTVLLGDDIDFSGYSDEFNPIGTNETNLFRGTFDGQGHAISNLAVNSSWKQVALFGIINGSSFKNVVVDSSCTVLNTHISIGEIVSVSGIIGHIQPITKKEPIVEGCVNMASVSFSGNNSGNNGYTGVVVSGVVGYFYHRSINFQIRNCVNYGTLTYAGATTLTSIGGILGAPFNEDYVTNYKCTVENCANYGRIVHSGVTEFMLGIGGIAGAILRGTVSNCINYATFSTNKESQAIGNILGGGSSVTIDKCYWTSETDKNVACGLKYTDYTTENNSYLVKSNITTMNTLNTWISENEKENERKYTKWMMLHLDGGGMNTVMESIMIVPQLKFPDPNKEGHNFVYWTIDNDSTEAYSGTLANVTDLYAAWKVNNYTVTFDYGNGTLVSESLTFNTTITYPNMKGVKKFRGWNSSLERMPAYDLVVGEKLPEPSKSNAGVIAGSVVGSLVVVAVVVVVVILFILHTKKIANDRDGASRMGIGMRRRRRGEARGNRRAVGRRAGENYVVGDRNLDMAAVSDDPTSTTTAVGITICFDALYPEYYRVPSMLDALVEAGLNRKNAQIVADVCKGVGEKAARAGKLAERLTEADAAAIAMYTFEFGPEESESNPYRLISKALTGAGNHDAVRGLLYLVMCALRKLPRYEDRLLYCGVRSGGADMSRYRKGEVVVWPTIASTSPDMKVAKELIEEDTDNEKENGESNGTLFVIENAWGYNIQSYSLCPEDGEEVLLEPGRHFQVDSVIESETTIVNLKMLNTPLILPQVFGGGDSN